MANSAAQRSFFRSTQTTRQNRGLQVSCRHQAAPSLFKAVVGKVSLCGEERLIVFDSTIRSDGQADEDRKGVLAVLFLWDALVQTIVNPTLVSTTELEMTRDCIVDAHGTLLAEANCDYGCTIHLPGRN